MKLIGLFCLLLAAYAKHPNFYLWFCEGHPKCYSIFEDPYMRPLWDINDFSFWGMDNAKAPYVSYAETAAMVATFTMRFVHKFMGFPIDMYQWLSASYIILKMHAYSYVNDYFNCTTPNELGSFAMYIGEDSNLYSDFDMPFGYNSSAWCDLETYQRQYDNRYGWRRFAYEMEEYEDVGNTFEQIRRMFWYYGMFMLTTSYCPDIMVGCYDFNPNETSKYYCEPDPPKTMWGTIFIFGVMEDEEGIWYAAYYPEATQAYNRLKWIKPSSRYYTEALQMFDVVYDTQYHE